MPKIYKWLDSVVSVQTVVTVNKNEWLAMIFNDVDDLHSLYTTV